MLLTIALAHADIAIEPVFEITGVNVYAGEEGVPVDFQPTVAFDAHGSGDATVLLTTEAGEVVATGDIQLYNVPGWLTVVPAAPLAADTAYVLTIIPSVAEEQIIPFQTGDGTALEAPVPVLTDSVDLRWSANEVVGGPEVDLGQPDSVGNVVGLLAEDGGFGGAAFPNAGEDIKDVDVRFPASHRPARFCATPVVIDRAGRQTVGEAACLHVETMFGCSSAPGSLVGVGIGLAVAAVAGRRKAG